MLRQFPKRRFQLWGAGSYGQFGTAQRVFTTFPRITWYNSASRRQEHVQSLACRPLICRQWRVNRGSAKLFRRCGDLPQMTYKLDSSDVSGEL
jgi:hypothetical protein